MRKKGILLNSGSGNSDHFDLQHRCAVLTGGANGIGRALALTFAGRGACVRILDVDGDGAEGVAREIVEAGGQCVVHLCDAANRTAAAAPTGWHED